MRNRILTALTLVVLALAIVPVAISSFGGTIGDRAVQQADAGGEEVCSITLQDTTTGARGSVEVVPTCVEKTATPTKVTKCTNREGCDDPTATPTLTTTPTEEEKCVNRKGCLDPTPKVTSTPTEVDKCTNRKGCDGPQDKPTPWRSPRRKR